MYGQFHDHYAHVNNCIGDIYFLKGLYSDALVYYHKSLAIRNKILNIEHKIGKSSSSKDLNHLKLNENKSPTKASDSGHSNSYFTSFLGESIYNLPANKYNVSFSEPLISIGLLIAEIDTLSGGPIKTIDNFNIDDSPTFDSLSYKNLKINRKFSYLLVDKALSILISQLGDNDLQSVSAMNILAELLLYDGETFQAKLLLDVASSVFHKILGLHNASTQSVHSNLDVMYELSELQAARLKKVSDSDVSANENEIDPNNLNEKNDEEKESNNVKPEFENSPELNQDPIKPSKDDESSTGQSISSQVKEV